MGYQATNYNITNYIWDAKKPTTITTLVGGFNRLENMKVNGKDYPIYYGK